MAQKHAPQPNLRWLVSKVSKGLPTYLLLAKIIENITVITIQEPLSMSNPSHDQETDHQTTSVAGMPLIQIVFVMVFGTTFVIAILVIAIFISHPTDFQYGVFRTVLATAAAGVAVFIPGMLHLTMERGNLLVLRAGGALAVFAIVYFFDPARWLVTVNTQDQAQVQINREGNNVINNVFSSPGTTVPKTEVDIR